MSGFFGAGGMGGNVERHIGGDDRDGAAIEAIMQTFAHPPQPSVSVSCPAPTPDDETYYSKGLTQIQATERIVLLASALSSRKGSTMTDHAKRIWLHAIAIVAKARNKCAPGERFEALNLVMGDLEDARRRDQLIMPDFPAVCPDCGQHCETHNGESDCAALQSGEAQAAPGFRAKLGKYSSVVGNSVHLIAPEGHFAGQVVIMGQDDRLRQKETQAALLGVIHDALNRRALAGDGK